MRSACDEVLGLSALVVQLPVDAGEVVRRRLRETRRRWFRTDEYIDCHVGGVDALLRRRTVVRSSWHGACQSVVGSRRAKGKPDRRNSTGLVVSRRDPVTDAPLP